VSTIFVDAAFVLTILVLYALTYGMVRLLSLPGAPE